MGNSIHLGFCTRAMSTFMPSVITLKNVDHLDNPQNITLSNYVDSIMLIILNEQGLTSILIEHVGQSKVKGKLLPLAIFITKKGSTLPGKPL